MKEEAVMARGCDLAGQIENVRPQPKPELIGRFATESEAFNTLLGKAVPEMTLSILIIILS
jgi:hypothetical protein